MSDLGSGELAKIRADVEDTLFDKCKVGTYSQTVTTEGDLTKTPTESAEISCGITFLSGSETNSGDVLVTTTAIKVRLPISTAITTLDRLSSLKKNGTAISGVYGIKNILRGVSCLVVEAEKVEI